MESANETQQQSSIAPAGTLEKRNYVVIHARTTESPNMANWLIYHQESTATIWLVDTKYLNMAQVKQWATRDRILSWEEDTARREQLWRTILRACAAKGRKLLSLEAIDAEQENFNIVGVYCGYTN